MLIYVPCLGRLSHFAYDSKVNVGVHPVVVPSLGHPMAKSVVVV